METEDYWKSLLQLAKAVKTHQEPIHYCFIKLEAEPEVTVNRLPVPDAHTAMLLVILQPDTIQDHPIASVFHLQGMSAQLTKNLNLPEEAISLLCLYLPYCFLSQKARQLQRAVAITHFAQSLDGKIATLQGDSKWIGNEQNLIHAHRMRALCDGILIGSKTMNCDHPSLTVRLVAGENPVRIVICSSEGDYSSLQSVADARLLVFGFQEDPCISHADYIRFSPEASGKIACRAMLESLYHRGIDAVYIEGGAATSSQFLKENMIDVVQLHIAPLIFGSGISGFVLPEISRVQQAVQFRRHRFQAMGDTYMFTGEMDHPAHA